MRARDRWACVGVGALALAATATRALRIHDDTRWSAERGRWVPQLDRTGDAAGGYAGSDACRACHPDAWSSWHGSYHRTMTQHATADSVLAQWSGALPGGVTLRWQGPRPEVVREGGDGPAVVEPVVMTTGSHHMQIYWTPDPATGALRAFEFAWLVRQGRFVPNAATLLRPDGDDAVYTWNRICIRCHAVDGNPGWREGAGRVRSEVAELGIACEACHGPAAAHAEHHRDPWRRYLAAGTVPSDVVQPRTLAPDRASQVCAQCHAITEFDDEQSWLGHGAVHAAGEPIADWGRLLRHPVRADEGDGAAIDGLLGREPSFFADRFWSDGMVRVTGREYNALVESPCNGGGALSCLSCHALHDGSRDDQLRIGMDGDGACSQCHDGAMYATSTHTHHVQGGAGSGCMDCHMPRTAWGLLGAIRSHQVDSPDAAIADATGRPLACNLCHLDRSSAWSAAWLRRWRGEEAPLPMDEGGDATRGLLAAEAGVRALWAWHLGFGPAVATGGAPDQIAALVLALGDPYPAVREVAWQSLLRRWPDAAHTVALPRGTIPDETTAARLRTELAAAMPAAALDPATIARWIAERDPTPVSLAE